MHKLDSTIEQVVGIHYQTGLPITHLVHIQTYLEDESDEAFDFAQRLHDAKCALATLAPGPRADAEQLLAASPPATEQEEAAAIEAAIATVLGGGV